jgi:DNA repair exonuclease SbcCD ATPase subunit
MISVDTRQAEVLVSFAGFLKLMSDPAGLKDLVSKLEEGVADYKKANGIYTTLEAADKQAAAKKAEIDAAVDAHNKLVDAFEAEKVSNAEDNKRKQAELASQSQKVADEAEKVSSKQKELNVLEVSLASVAQSQTQKATQLQTLQESLDARQKELDAKAEKLKALLG